MENGEALENLAKGGAQVSIELDLNTNKVHGKGKESFRIDALSLGNLVEALIISVEISLILNL